MTDYNQLLEEAKAKMASISRMTAANYIPAMYEALRNETPSITPQEARERIEKDCRGIWNNRTILELLPAEAKNHVKQKSGRLGQMKRNSAAISAAPQETRKEILIDTQGKILSRDPTLPSTNKYNAIVGKEESEDAVPSYLPKVEDQPMPELEPLVTSEPQKHAAMILKDKVSTLDEVIQRTVLLEAVIKEKDRNEVGLYTEIQRLTNQINSFTEAVPSLIEFHMEYRRLQEYMAKMYKLGAANIWLTIQLDRTTGKVTEILLGRYSKSGNHSQSVGV